MEFSFTIQFMTRLMISASYLVPMSIRGEYPGIEGKREYLREILEDYYASDRVRLGSLNGWVGHGIRSRSMSTLWTVFVLIFATSGLLVLNSMIDSSFVCLALIVSAIGLLLTVIYMNTVFNQSEDTKHPGWYRSIDMSLTETVERVFKSLVAGSYDVEAYRGKVDDKQLDARGTIFDIPRIDLTVTVVKNIKGRSSTIILVETHDRKKTGPAKRIRSIIDGAVHIDSD